MNTALGSNLGLTAANIERAQQIGGFNQQAANFMGDAQTHANRAQMIGQVTNFGENIFANMAKQEAKIDKQQGLQK